MRLDEEELCAFVRDFLALSGTPCRKEDGVYSIQGDYPLLDGAGQLSFTFSREKSAPDLDHLTYGHPLVDRMLALASRRGRTTSLIFPVKEQFPPFQGPWRPVPRALIYQSEFLFNFRIVYLGHERVEEVVTIWLDSYTEQRLPPLDLSLGAGFRPPRTCRVRSKADSLSELENLAYQPVRLFRRALVYLQEEIDSRRAELESLARSKLARDVERLTGYYESLAQEEFQSLRSLFRKLAVANVRCDLARTDDTRRLYGRRALALRAQIRSAQEEYEERLALLREEHGRRLQELWGQTAVDVEVSLVSGAHLWVPRWEVELWRGGECIPGHYDPLRNKWLEPLCTRCEGEITAIDREAILCEGCAGEGVAPTNDELLPG
ncbi:MAG: hypothetical protein GX182_05110 [Firmicutes bacterium]|jgi:hypothetical protein|nr:hypothetical protein [Bacillota bacterium]